MDQSLNELSNVIRQSAGFLSAMKAEISRIIVGQDHMIDCAIIALLTGGHILLEGVPGLAKTLLCNTVANVVDCQFHRIQFTPDLLPADLIGSLAYRQDNGSFYAKKGPVFANLVLADEINRAPAKVQSALLEAMQEKQVTIGDTTYPLPRPFLVVATQNPIDQEGTYPLPEAQVDRFMLKVTVDYPSFEEEKKILQRMTSPQEISVNSITTASNIITAASNVEKIYIDERIQNYIVSIVYATRHPEQFGLPKVASCIARGASPRATISLANAAKAAAFMDLRAFVSPEDVQKLVVDVLQHRISLTYEAEADNLTSLDIIEAIMGKIEVP
ncbi:MAG: MoxR family ATPase [Proteobacteria bacterium]|nr:MoxR family ATPase [Pseudomonadota bacterium]